MKPGLCKGPALRHGGGMFVTLLLALSATPPDAAFDVPDDLVWERVLTEPDVAQPVFLTFDERGRMWVCEYRQYPYPAGLRMLSRDEYWRAVYDRVPDPPPHGPRGADRISIHEDRDGDGTFETHRVFLDGLNLATSVAVGRGGVWVLQPPYLLFYPDADRDDVPDGDPEVHLAGFGLEDTHSVANSLTWGPDGWLYAAQGSTVSGAVRRWGADGGAPVRTMGQLIWRYHPRSHRYEVFAEGGGNAFGIEFDDAGRLFSGHNGGDTRGFHYVRGGYYRKGFDKHGPLSNPYAFGYYEPMGHPPAPRFTHDLLRYQDRNLPPRYRGRLLGVEPLQGRITVDAMTPVGATFRTEDVERVVAERVVAERVTPDGTPRFRPVQITAGPDGAVYVADFHEAQISHREHFAGEIEKDTGRVYRLRGGDAAFRPVDDLAAKTDGELIALLAAPNRWTRRTANRVLADRASPEIIALLRESLEDPKAGALPRPGLRTPPALELLWALAACGGFDEATATHTLAHPDPHVRRWTVRLLGDDRDVTDAGVTEETAARLAALAGAEPDVSVRVQLAATARRLPVGQRLAIVAPLARRDADRDDPFAPLMLWWAVEATCTDDPDAAVEFFADPSLWNEPLVAETLVPRVMRRFAATGRRADLLRCAALLRLAPDAASRTRLLAGFEEAFAGRPLVGLPDELAEELERAGGGSLALRVRRGDAVAVADALARLADPSADRAERIELAGVLGEAEHASAIPVLLDLFDDGGDGELRSAALAALAAFPDVRIADRVLARLTGPDPPPVPLRDTAVSLLAGRAGWSRRLLGAVDAGRLDPSVLSADALRRIGLHPDGRVAALLAEHFADAAPPPAERRAEIARVAAVLEDRPGDGRGDPYRGKPLYAERCGRCHRLFGEGGSVGPELTAFDRDDLSRMLPSILDPAAEVREGFGTWLALTGDGRVLTGFLTDRDGRTVTLRTADGRTVTLARDELDLLEPRPDSLMPDGLLRDLSDGQVRDLFAYLRSAQPLNERR